MKGIAITLKKKTKTGTDAFGQDIYTETDVQVNDVLVGEPSAEDVQTAIVRYGKKIAYTLAIPKGDTNDWYKAEVVLWGETFNVIGDATMGIEENIPLRWNKKVHLERING